MPITHRRDRGKSRLPARLSRRSDHRRHHHGACLTYAYRDIGMSAPGERATMRTRIGINGFGRMGRLALRAAWAWPELEFVHVNEIKGGPETAAHLLEFDSVHGRWDRPIAVQGGALVVDGKKVGFSAQAAPGEV